MDEDASKFEKDLKSIRPMIDEMFDFEKKIAQNTKVNYENFCATSYFSYFRTVLTGRWELLNNSNTYQDMIRPLSID